jgi:hypothetical protein
MALPILDTGVAWSAPRPGSFIQGKRIRLLVKETGWATSPFWLGTENLAPDPAALSAPPSHLRCSDSNGLYMCE